MSMSVNRVEIWHESELMTGDVAVYAAAGGTRAMLIARVRAGEGQERHHSSIEDMLAHGRSWERPLLLGPRDHFGRVVLSTNGGDYYVPSAEANRFLIGYRFFNEHGERIKARAMDLRAVVEADLGRDFAQLLETNDELTALR